MQGIEGFQEWFLWLARQSAFGSISGRRPAFGEDRSHSQRDSTETYGAPRIHFELKTLGVRCARKRVARLMREAGLFGCGGARRKARTTLRSRTERTPPAPDLVERNFTAEAPNRLWVADITFVPTAAGFLYLAVVLGVRSWDEVVRVDLERTWVFGPSLADGLEGRWPAQGLEVLGEVVGGHEGKDVR